MKLALLVCVFYHAALLQDQHMTSASLLTTECEYHYINVGSSVTLRLYSNTLGHHMIISWQ